MNILCEEGGFVGKFVNEGYLGLPRGRHCYEGDWFKMREPPSKWGSVGNYEYARNSNKMPLGMYGHHKKGQKH